MKISVVTISFNQERFLSRAITSVISQSYKNYEYIIVDPGSTDGSRELIMKYKNYFSNIIFERDDGPADGLNKGFSKATGELFYYLNSDDIVQPGAFEYVVNYFMKYQDCDVLIGNGYQIDINDKILRKIYSTRWSTDRYACGQSISLQQATFIRRRAFQSICGFNAKNKTCWDGELLVDLSLNRCRFRNTNKFLGGFRHYSESITGSGRLKQCYDRDQKLIAYKILGRQKDLRELMRKYIYLIERIITNPYVAAIYLIKKLGFIRSLK